MDARRDDAIDARTVLATAKAVLGELERCIAGNDRGPLDGAWLERHDAVLERAVQYLERLDPGLHPRATIGLQQVLAAAGLVVLGEVLTKDEQSDTLEVARWLLNLE